MTVAHKGSTYIYPVVEGSGWQGGVVSEVIDIPKDDQELKEEEERLLREEWEQMELEAAFDGTFDELYISPPAPATAADAEVVNLAQWNNRIQHRSFRWIQCHRIVPISGPKKLYAGGDCGNPFTGQLGVADVAFSYGIRGSYYIVPGEWVKHKGSPTDYIECDKLYNRANVDDQGIIHTEYFIDPDRQCKWYGKTKYGEQSFAEYGRHLTPFGEWHWGSGSPTYWVHHSAGLALYIWASKDRYVGHHNTTCIDC